jgi:PAS domain S-box-containing protein
VDVGTSGAKVVLMDEGGRVLRSTAGEYPLATPRPGWTEQDPEDWWRVARRCLDDIEAPAPFGTSCPTWSSPTITCRSSAGGDALQLVRQTAERVPFILVTGSLNEETAVEYMKAGAADYLLKDRITRLGPAVLAVLEQKRVREEQERARRAAEEEVRAQRAFLRALIDHSPNLVFVKDWDGRFVLADVYGTTVEALVGKTDVEHFLGDDRALMEGGRPKVIPEEPVMDARTGKARWFQTVKVPLRLPGYDRPLVLVVGTDITERRRLEEQVRLAQKLEAVGTLASGVAHDFNNLLGAIRATVELALLDLPPDTPVHGDLTDVLEHADRATALTRQLLAFGRKQVLEARIVDLNGLVADIVKLLTRVIGEDIQLVFEQTPDPTTVSADPGQIEQVLMNLCVNARDALPRGGELAVLTERVSIDEEFCATDPWARPGDYVRLTVSDTGIGMDAATQARIFEPFFTTKAMGRGTGLGLAVVYGIVKQHGGLIHVYSEPGKGTSFRVYFPFRAEAPEVTAAEEAGELVGGSERVVLAEDDDALRATTTRLLRRLGYEVVSVVNGSEALELLLEEGATFDLAMLDLVMPGTPGSVVFERVHERHPKLRFLLTTGYGAGTAHVEPLNALPARVLTKPYGIRELARAVRRALEPNP